MSRSDDVDHSAGSSTNGMPCLTDSWACLKHNKFYELCAEERDLYLYEGLGGEGAIVWAAGTEHNKGQTCIRTSYFCSRIIFSASHRQLLRILSTPYIHLRMRWYIQTHIYMYIYLILWRTAAFLFMCKIIWCGAKRESKLFSHYH